MEFNVKTFSTVRLCVSNVRESRDWYRSFFRVEPVEDMDNFASFRIGATVLDITLADEKNPVSHGGTVGYWLVDDLDSAIETARRLGGKVYRGPLKVDEIQRTIVQIMDPYGNVVGLESES